MAVTISFLQDPEPKGRLRVCISTISGSRPNTGGCAPTSPLCTPPKVLSIYPNQCVLPKYWNDLVPPSMNFEYTELISGITSINPKILSMLKIPTAIP